MKRCETDILDQPPLSYFVVGGGSGRRNAEGRLQHGGSWRVAKEWPPEGTRIIPFYFSADGTLAAKPPEKTAASEFTYDPSDPVPTLGGNFSDPRVAGLFNC